MPRTDSPPDDPAYDDETPPAVQERMRALEKLCREQHAALGPHGDPPTYQEWSAMQRRACELLDLDPPGFDPTTEGP